MGKIVAFVLAGGRSERMGVLTKLRAKAALPFGGRYRIIDFALSNCVNSRIHDVQVAAQYSPRSLQQHVRLGRPWDLDRRDSGVLVLQPYTGRQDSVWYRGTADAIYRNLDMIRANHPQMVLVLSGDQVYRMNYGEMIRQHLRNKAQVTIAVKPVSPEDSKRFGMVETDGHQVTRFEEKPANTDMRLANLGIYLFNTADLVKRLSDTVPQNRFDIVWDLIMPAVEDRQVSAFVFDGFWQDIGEVDAYYEANLGLLPSTSGYLHDEKWPLYTRSEERPPAKFGRQAKVVNSVVANGCRIFGQVERSIIFPGALVGEDAIVRDSILFSGASVYRGAVVSRTILDKRAIIGDDAIVGCDSDITAELGDPRSDGQSVRTCKGLTIIGKDSHIPSGFVSQKPIMFDSHLTEDAVRSMIVS